MYTKSIDCHFQTFFFQNLKSVFTGNRVFDALIIDAVDSFFTIEQEEGKLKKLMKNCYIPNKTLEIISSYYIEYQSFANIYFCFRLQFSFLIVSILFSSICIQQTYAQLTFSKNWNPGKRDQGEQKVSINALCHFLVVSSLLLWNNTFLHQKCWNNTF